MLGAADAFFLPIIHALTGSVLIDQSLSAYRLHGANIHSALPGFDGMANTNVRVRVESFNSYLRVLSWLIDHVDDVVLMSGIGKYWQLFNTVTSTHSRTREACSRSEFKAVMARRYLRFVDLFGEFQVFCELRKRLLFPEYLDVLRVAHGRALPIVEFSRAFFRETVRKIRLLCSGLRSRFGSEGPNN